jgi:glutamine synthetase
MERRNTIKSPQEALVLCRENDVKAVDLRFTDLFGRAHHITVPVAQLTAAAFEDGFGFDGSSIRNWQAIDESDMLLVPQAESAWLDPFTNMPTLVLTCGILDPITREEYARDPRNIAQRAENYLVKSGVADTAYFGPEAEFFIFDDVRYDQRPEAGFYYLDSCEAAWNRGRDEAPNLGHKIRYKEGYFPCAPLDQTVDLRSEMMQALIDCGIDVEGHHHEVATAGQAELDIQFNTLVAMADNLMTYKYVVKNVARRHGKTVTFMPKPVMGDNGSGLHVHLSLWKAGESLLLRTNRSITV